MKRLLIPLLILTLASCAKKTVNSKNVIDSTPSNPSNPDTVITPGLPDIVEDQGVGAGLVAYYKISPIVAHGSQRSSDVLWSSTIDLPSGYDQSMFQTDGRLNIRLRPLSDPGKGTASTGKECRYGNDPGNSYTKLSAVVRVSSTGAGSYAQQQEIPATAVNSASPVIVFTPPSASSFKVELLKVNWDYSCRYDGGYGSHCPMSYVWHTQCFAFEMHVATSGTTDIPRN